MRKANTQEVTKDPLVSLYYLKNIRHTQNNSVRLANILVWVQNANMLILQKENMLIEGSNFEFKWFKYKKKNQKKLNII